jgi:hypothetical protein
MITTKENIEERMKCIPMLAMPKTFREAVELCRYLHIPYLWIDALCIVQPNGPDGDDEDWQNQSAIMNQIYGQALLTIAATDAANVHQGCFTTPSSRLGNVPKSCHLFASKSLQTMVLKPGLDVPGADVVSARCSLHRAWHLLGVRQYTGIRVSG